MNVEAIKTFGYALYKNLGLVRLVGRRVASDKGGREGVAGLEGACWAVHVVASAPTSVPNCLYHAGYYAVERASTLSVFHFLFNDCWQGKPPEFLDILFGPRRTGNMVDEGEIVLAP